MRSMWRSLGFGALGVLLSIQPGFVQTSEKLIVLTTQDLPRSVLAEMAARISDPEEVRTKGVGVPFIFPDDLKPEFTYGIDISHYTFGKGKRLDWQSLAPKGVSFVYIKASQGSRYIDGYFKSSWAAAGAASTSAMPLYRGAYHFLAADVDPVAQAQTFLKVLRENADFVSGRDLPPVLDLEWDCKTDARGRVLRDAKGNCVADNWTKYEPVDIAKKVSAASQEIETTLHVKPMIYTNAQWWRSVNLGSNQFLSGRLIWIADYTKKAQRVGKSAVPPTYTETLWQFTENGKLMPSCVPTNIRSECIDTNVARMELADFLKAVGITKP